MWILFVALMGCKEPSESSPGALVGRLLDPQGQPVRGARVDGVEAGARTDADGRFAVRMKDPDRFVMIGAGGRLYRRAWRAEDNGLRVDVRLPALRDAELECALPAPCRARFEWELGEALSLVAEADCDPSASTPLAGIPTAKPARVSCAAAGAEVPVVLVDGGTRLTLGGEAEPVRVRILGREQADARACTVLVDGRLAAPQPDGSFVGRAAGRAVISAVCDGRPALPVQLGPSEPEVAVEWSAVGVDLSLEGAPEVGALLVVREGRGGFSLRSTPNDAGLFPLPPLTAGVYRVGSTAQLLIGPPPAGAAPPEREGLVLYRVGDGLIGWLRLDADRAEGTVAARLVAP